MGSVARCHSDEEMLPDGRGVGGDAGGGVTGPEARLLIPRLELERGGMEVEGDSLPQSGFDCPEVSVPLVRRGNWLALPMPEAPGEMPGSCPV